MHHNKFRLFFAVQFETELQIALTKLIKQLQHEKWGHRVHWVRPEKLHFTLRFIGGSKPEQISCLVQNFAEAIKEIKSFELQLNAVHLFPSPDKPHVVSVGVVPSKELFQLVGSLEKAVAAADYRAEKRTFLPHLTLGRITHRPVIIEAGKYKPEANGLLVKEIVLLNSEQTERGQEYRVVEKVKLKI